MGNGNGITRKHFLAGAGAALALGALPRLGHAQAADYKAAMTAGDMGALTAAAKKEGSVTAYIAMAQEPFVAWSKGFTEKYGIPVLAQMQGDNPLFSRWSQETRAAKHIADFVIFSGEDLLNQAQKAGWVANYVPATDDKFQEGVTKRRGRWYGMYDVVEPIIFNTSQMSQAEADSLLAKNFDALLDKAWVGRTATVPASASDRVYATYYRLQQERGWDFLAKLAATKPTFENTGTSAVANVAGGEVAVLIAGGTDSLAARQVQSGAPVQFVFGPSTTATMEYGALSANAPHPAAARLFYEWATSDEGLTSMAKITQGLPGRAGIPDNRPVTSKPWYKAPTKLDVDWSIDEKEAEARPAFLAQWAKVFNYSK